MGFAEESNFENTDTTDNYGCSDSPQSTHYANIDDPEAIMVHEECDEKCGHTEDYRYDMGSENPIYDLSYTSSQGFADDHNAASQTVRHFPG